MLEKDYTNAELNVKFKAYIDEDFCVWFKAKEVAQILGYQKTRNAIEKHVSKKYKKEAPIQGPLGGEQTCVIINEAGFYELVFKSRLPAAKIFREWVFEKVLPSIRKHGYYISVDRRVVVDDKKYYKHQVFSNYAANEDGSIINVKTGKRRKMNISNSGYSFFSLYNKNLDKPKIYTQHRFVYEVFRGPIPKCFEIHHRNSNKNDNHISNLELLTHQQNIREKYNH